MSQVSGGNLILFGIYIFCRNSFDWNRIMDKLINEFFFVHRSSTRSEEIIRNMTWNHLAGNAAMPAKLLRMHFHDCFVRKRA